MTQKKPSFTLDGFKFQLQQTGWFDSKMRARFSIELVRKIVDLSNLRQARFASEIGIGDALLRAWYLGVSPGARKLGKFRRFLGITFYFGARGPFFPATPAGVLDALARRKKDQVFLAEKAGISASFLNKFLKTKTGTKTGLSVDRWEKFASALGVRFFVQGEKRNGGVKLDQQEIFGSDQ